MRTIHRFPLEIKSDTQPVQWRKSGIIRMVGQKNPNFIEIDTDEGVKKVSFIDLFVEIDDDDTEFETRHFVIVGTGHPIPQDVDYIASVIQRSEDIFGGALVWHVFEKSV